MHLGTDSPCRHHCRRLWLWPGSSPPWCSRSPGCRSVSHPPRGAGLGHAGCVDTLCSAWSWAGTSPLLGGWAEPGRRVLCREHRALPALQDGRQHPACCGQLSPPRLPAACVWVLDVRPGGLPFWFLPIARCCWASSPACWASSLAERSTGARGGGAAAQPCWGPSGCSPNRAFHGLATSHHQIAALPPSPRDGWSGNRDCPGAAGSSVPVPGKLLAAGAGGSHRCFSCAAAAEPGRGGAAGRAGAGGSPTQCSRLETRSGFKVNSGSLAR